MEFINLIIIIIGLIFGSFISCISYRIVHNEDMVYKPSHCTACKHTLSWYDLVPLFSWLSLLGRCRYCKHPVSLRYPLIEICVAFMTWIIYQKFGLSIQGFLLFITSLSLVVMIVTDFEHYIIPDSMQVIAGVIGVALGVINHLSVYNILITSIIFAFIGIALRAFFLWWKDKDALGIGDIKFLAVAGTYISLNDLSLFLFMSGVFGIITGVVWEKLGHGKIFPFGPALVSSMFICVIEPGLINRIVDSIFR